MRYRFLFVFCLFFTKHIIAQNSQKNNDYSIDSLEKLSDAAYYQGKRDLARGNLLERDPGEGPWVELLQ